MLLFCVEVLARPWNLAIVNLFEPVEYCSRCGSCQLLEDYRSYQRFVVIIIQSELVRSQTANDLPECRVVFLEVSRSPGPYVFLSQVRLCHFLTQSCPLPSLE